MAEVSMQTCLMDVLCENLFEIFRRLPKDKLIEISELNSKFRHVAGDTRLWKNAAFFYECDPKKYFAFEELYSEPWPVQKIDLYGIEIKPPVSPKTDQVIKVTHLNLSWIKVDNVTLEAILAKYHCTELRLDYNSIDLQGRIHGIAPEVFSNQTALEVLSLSNMGIKQFNGEFGTWIDIPYRLWLAPILDNCKNLKSLDLSHNQLTNPDLLSFVKNLPSSLEKLFLGPYASPEDSFFERLAKSTPNLRELELYDSSRVKYPSLLKFQVLEALHVIPLPGFQGLRDLSMYLIKFPALRTVHVDRAADPKSHAGINHFEYLRTTLEPHGIIVRLKEFPRERPEEEVLNPQDNNFLLVSK